MRVCRLFRFVSICNDNVTARWNASVYAICGYSYRRLIRGTLLYLRLKRCSISLNKLLSFIWAKAAACCLTYEGRLRATAGVVELRGCSGENRLAYSSSTQIQLRRYLLLRVVCARYPSVGVFLYYGFEDYIRFNCKFVVYLVVWLGFV
jgi:hypothetical protein